MSATTTEALICSFCGKDEHSVAKLVAGPGVYICGECVDLCNQILVADGPAELLADLAEKSVEELIDVLVRIHRSHASVDQTADKVVRELRSRKVAWAKIGEALGMTRQSAWERFSGEE